MKFNKKNLIFLWFFMLGANSFSMHIMEGFLPPLWCGIWGALCVPFILVGFSRIKKKIEVDSKMKMLIAVVGAFAFVLSALKIPSVTGSSSHPTGVGLAAILFGPAITSVLGLIVLIFQAILLAHGGITTLGANIVGPIVSYFIYKGLKKTNRSFAIFLAAALGDLLTYVTTSIQLGLAFPDPNGGFLLSASKFMGIFAVTQVPLAISEGLLTVVVFNILMNYNKETLNELEI